MSEKKERKKERNDVGEEVFTEQTNKDINHLSRQVTNEGWT